MQRAWHSAIGFSRSCTRVEWMLGFVTPPDVRRSLTLASCTWRSWRPPRDRVLGIQTGHHSETHRRAALKRDGWIETRREGSHRVLVKLAADLRARGVVSQEPADRFGRGGKMLGILPRLEQLSGRRECGDLAAGFGWVELIDSGEDEHRRAERPHLVPGHADGEVGSPHCGGELLDLVAGEIVAVVHELVTPLLPQVVKEFPVARGDPDRLLEDGRDDSFRRDCEQLQDERAADAAAEHQEAVDPKMIHDRELVSRVDTPRVAGLKRAGGLAGVALVHR